MFHLTYLCTSFYHDRVTLTHNMQMDRTSILGDTIDYMKELLEKIHKLKMNDTQANSNQINSLGNLKELNKITEATTKSSSRVRVCTYTFMT